MENITPIKTDAKSGKILKTCMLGLMATAAFGSTSLPAHAQDVGGVSQSTEGTVQQSNGNVGVRTYNLQGNFRQEVSPTLVGEDLQKPIPKQVLVWQFGGKPGNISSQNQYSTANAGNGYNMLCETNNQFLTYKKTNFGINLGYTTNSGERKIHFRLPDGQERQILSGEKVALGIGGGDAFLRYAQRTAGINLDWASNPSFEWRIYGATTEKGKPIPAGSSVAIVNENVEPEADFLVHLDRPVGADVGWTTSPDWKGKLTDWLTDQAFKALIAALL